MKSWFRIRKLFYMALITAFFFDFLICNIIFDNITSQINELRDNALISKPLSD